MRLLTQALIHTAIALTLAANQKDSDEGRPYEFGFTIDGQQHRHEKKDQNGIIQGEFGFITADGVYHVTVYATDENGNFKILSMRNIRISAPLDGSPAWGPISPEAGKYLSKIPSTTAAPGKQFERLQEQPVAPQGSITTTRRPFTTQSTIKPACAGCGYVTTSAPLRPGELPAFQRQGTPRGPPAPAGIPSPAQQLGGSYPGQPGPGPFQQQSLSNQISPQLPPDVELLPPSVSPGSFPAGPQSIRQEYQNVQTGGVQQTFQSGQTGSLQQSFQSGQTGGLQQSYQSGQRGSNEQSFQSGRRGSLQQSYQNGQVAGERQNLLGPLNGGRTLQTLQQNNVKQNLVVPVDVRYGNENSPLNAPPFGTGPNPILQPGEVSKLPPISVGDNVIHVGGSNPKDIPIKDKYPGMVDGLPAGVGESDVKDILYKFKYTVGFHGHYERGLKNGAKIGGYFVNGRDGISRVVTYVADENGYRPKFKFINLGLDSSDTPKEGTEKTFGLKDFEFVWYPIE